MKRKKMSLLMRISVCSIICGLLAFMPSTSPAEEFECVHCYSGIWSRYHLNYDLPLTFIWEYKGIFLCK